MSELTHGFLVGNGILQPEKPRRLGGSFFAFTSPLHGGRPEVFEYPDSPEGRAELLSLIRGEKIHKIVFGEAVPFINETRTQVTLGPDTVVDSQQISKG